MKKAVLLLLLAGVSAFSAGLTCAPAQSSEKWAKDIDILIEKIETFHPRPWARIPQKTFLERAERLKRDLAGKSDEEIAVSIMKLVALIRDGHTRVWLNGQDHFNKWFPVRLEKFQEGIFVTAIDARHANALGAQVVRMDQMDMNEVYRRLCDVIFADSLHGVAKTLSNFLSNATLLKALRIVDDADTVSLELRWPEGKRERVALDSAAWDAVFNWAWTKNAVPTSNPTVGFFDGKPLPLYLRKMWGARPSYWFEWMPEDRMLYFQINEFSESGDEPFAKFIDRMFKSYDEHRPEIGKFIIDVRFNEGGDGSLVKPLLHEFIKRQATLPRGKLYIITGPYTFSAASNLIGQMLAHTQVITVGDIASGPLNWCSDVIKFTLPNSRLMVDISTMSWQTGDATDSRGYYPPDCYFPWTAKDFFSGKDLALDAIKTNQARSLREILLKDGAKAFEAEYDRRVAQYGPPENWFPYLPNDLSLFAMFELAPAGKIDEALAASRLNTRLYPNDLRSWFALAMLNEAKGDLGRALADLEKAAALEPHYAELNWNVERLKATLHPFAVDEARLNKYVGRFGTRRVFFEQGSLFYQRDGGAKVKLIPVSAVEFLLEGNNNNRLTMVLNGDVVEGIKMLSYSGTSRFYKKTGN